MAPQVRTVGQALVIYLEHDIVDRVDLLEIRAVGDVVGDLHDARMIVADTELLFGAAHTAAHKAGKRPRSDLDLTELGAHLSKGGFHPDTDVRRAADNVDGLVRTAVHLQQMELF